VVRGTLVVGGFTSDTFTCVPGCVVALATVSVVGTAGDLTLSEILNCSEHVSCNGFHIFNDFLNDYGLGVSVLDSLVMDSFSSTVQ
jgi:hypothetical protein